MKFSEIIEQEFGIKFKRKKGETNLDIIKQGVSKRGLSLVHIDFLKSIPKDRGIWTDSFEFSPASYYSKRGKQVRKRIREKLKSNPK